MSGEEPPRWWHAYGAPVPGLSVDEVGRPLPAWVAVTIGDSTLGPTGVLLGDSGRTVQDAFPWEGFGAKANLLYLGSWDHEPSPAEIDAVTPEEYRDDDAA